MHIAIAVDNTTSIEDLIYKINQGQLLKQAIETPFKVYHKKALEAFIDEEVKHDNVDFKKKYGQSLQSMSSGEQKIRFLKSIFENPPKGLILDNPLAHLDVENQQILKETLLRYQDQTTYIFLFKQFDWIPESIEHYYQSFDREFKTIENREEFLKLANTSFEFSVELPTSLQVVPTDEDLVRMNEITVTYQDRPILNKINWTIKQGDFWELRGPNGSGKTTLLSMLTGENPKGYGQDLFLFGYQKGTGETIWDIKKNIGYYTPSMTAFFTGYHTVEEMIIGGLKDSIGLYVKPSKMEEIAVTYWLQLIGLESKKEQYFTDLSLGEQSLIMTARAMVKMPKLLILDEPTAGLDHRSNQLFMSLINAIAKAHQVAIVFVSHKRDPLLKATQIFELIPDTKGSSYKIYS